MPRKESAHDSRNRALITSRLAAFGIFREATPAPAAAPESECRTCHEPEYAKNLHDGRCTICLHAAAKKGERDAAVTLLPLLKKLDTENPA